MVRLCLSTGFEKTNALSLTHTAGHYVPATAKVILESNSIYAKNLKGIGIGNGWVDPKVQYEAYAEVC